ncbi:MAG: 2,3-bisphosphoglycerate-independent phosphoglycerate mutase [Candidatus Aenigmarchaeota archaeon]|nr:2,3-bisphosphoglycerate-independent phosphoglycerate mutase [Candidatus Aenigmarchaeota archaeon]
MNSLILIVLDGWGINKKVDGNAIALAKPKNFDRLWKGNPHTQLKAFGTAVGLPGGMLGGSEVGHLHLGAGRIVPQDLTRINKSIKSGNFFKNKALISAIKNVIKKHSSLHILGLLSDAGVHSHISHFFAVLKLAKKFNLKNVFIDVFLDGRDTPPKSAEKYLKILEKEIKKIGIGKIASISGRYYAMDRDTRWKRVKLVYDLLTIGKGRKASNVFEALHLAYKLGETDEFVKPTLIDSNSLIKDGDSIIFVNFRSDRARQLTGAFTKKRFGAFRRVKRPKVMFVTFTEYEKGLNAKVAFKPLEIKNTFGEWISGLGLKQLRIAETEKYAHVTYFFNGGAEKPFRDEDRVLIPSPRVSTYDKKPEMSAYKITKKLLRVMHKYDFILVNYANPDMVGHTGNLKATIKAIKVVDKCLGVVVDSALRNDMVVAIVGDHGNAEQMIDYKTGQPITSHTFNPVPFIIINYEKNIILKRGGLSNVAATLLKLMGLEKPREMTSKSLW